MLFLFTFKGTEIVPYSASVWSDYQVHSHLLGDGVHEQKRLAQLPEAAEEDPGNGCEYVAPDAYVLHSINTHLFHALHPIVRRSLGVLVSRHLYGY